MFSRRRFLKVGLVLKAGLAASAVPALSGTGPAAGAQAPAGPALREDAAARAIFGAVVPAVLAGALPAAGQDRERAIARTVEGMQAALRGLPEASRAEMRQLCALLSFAPARIVLAGLWSDWAHAGTADVAAFLQRWRDSRFTRMRAGYAALRDLAAAAWYADPDAWPAIGYPGPPEVA